MKKSIFLLGLIILSIFVMPANADTVSYTPIPIVTIEPYEPWNDINMQWFIDGLFDPIAFLKTAVFPYTDILGAYFYLILYTLFCILVYFRSRGLELLVISIGVTFGVWVNWMPPDTVYLFLICVAIGITAMLFKLFNKR